MNNYYVYAFLDPRDSVVRYIGQGVGRRFRWWRRIEKGDIPQYGVRPWLQKLKETGLEPIVFIVLERLTKEQKNRWEIDLIDLIGRVSEGTGPLLNLSSGGEGTTGLSAAPVKSTESLEYVR